MITEGILNIDKPQNMTSHDVVSVLRRTLGIRKIGHTGTLDPMATGVLPVCIGKSTRVIEYLDMDMKKYRCTMELGLMTDTQDIWGQVIERRPVTCSEEEVREAFSGFSGVIEQKPPMYSALKVDGKRLYEYAREGKTVEVKTRKIYINSLEILSVFPNGENTVTFTVECSKGTYIRTICQDVGDALGCCGTLTALERISSGIFSIEDAVNLERLKSMTTSEIENLLYPSSAPLLHFGKVITDEEAGLKFATGWHLPLRRCRISRKPEFEKEDFYLPIRPEFRRAYNVYAPVEGQETFIGVAFYDPAYKKLVADKIFYVRG